MKKSTLTLLFCGLWLGFAPFVVAEAPVFRFGWGAGEAAIKAYMGESHRVYVEPDTFYAMPQGEQEWGRSMGKFRHSQYKYIETVCGWPAETSYNFFQGKLYTKAIVLDAYGVSLEEARELGAKLEAAIREVVPGGQWRRHSMDLPLWGAVPENEPLPPTLRDNSQLQPADLANSWVVGASWQNERTMARIMGSWNDIRQKAHFMVLLGERGHLMVLDDEGLNDVIWEAPPAASWRRVFANYELSWGMDTSDVIALENGRHASGSVMPDHGYYLQYMYKTWAGEPMDVIYSFHGGLSGVAWAIYPETEGRQAFEALERDIAGILTRELETAEIKVRPRPADDDVNARFKDMGVSEWDNGETMASLSGNFYADGGKENCIIVSLVDRKHPYNASFVQLKTEWPVAGQENDVNDDK